MVKRGKQYDCSDSGYREGGLFRHRPVMASLQQVYAARNPAKTAARGLTFDSICRRKTALLTIGQAALEDAREFMDGRPCALFILDETACILSRCGEPQTLAQLADWGFATAATARRALSAPARCRWPRCRGSRSTPPAIGILSRPCSHGAFVRRRCSITTGGCSALSRFAV